MKAAELNNHWTVEPGRAGLQPLLRPARPPRGWPILASTLLLFSAALLAWMLWDGAAQGEMDLHLGEKRLGTWLSVALLIASGVVSLLVQQRLRDLPFERFWGLSAIGLVFLGLDDQLKIHEQTDFAIHDAFGWSRGDPLTDHIDDLIILVYGLLFLGLFVYWRRHVLVFRAMVWSLVVAAACLCGMIYVDAFLGDQAIEESLKIAGGVFILIGYLAAWRHPAVRHRTPGRYREHARGNADAGQGR